MIENGKLLVIKKSEDLTLNSETKPQVNVKIS